MAYELSHDISIGNYRLRMVERVSVETSQNLLSDICRIYLPGMQAGVSVQVDDKIRRGDRVVVNLGYDGNHQQEFTGYVKAIYPDSPLMIECEDSIYLFRRIIPSKIFSKVGVKTILEYVVAQINTQVSAPFSLVTDLNDKSYIWDKFTIHNATGFEVLDKLRNESGLMIYARGNELHCHLAYTNATGKAIYDFAVNIEATSNLKYVKAADQKVKVVVHGRTDKGAKIEGQFGENGGDVITLQRPTVGDRTTLENIAKQESSRLTYDGYRGEIQGWLIPYCTTGFSAVIRDRDYPARQGTYYVLSTKVEFSQNGGVRTIELGARIS